MWYLLVVLFNTFFLLLSEFITFIVAQYFLKNQCNTYSHIKKSAYITETIAKKKKKKDSVLKYIAM